jgi:signal transduction histidine kinase
MDAYVLRLPALAEAVTRGAVLGLSTAAPASADGRWFDLAAEVRLEQSTSLDLEQVDLETAFRETARFGGRTALRATLAPALAKLRAGVTHHAALLREAVGHRDGLASDRPALTQASLEALDQIRGLHQRIGPELDALIAARAERHRAERQDGLVAAGAAAAVLAYLFVAIYLSIRSSMKAVRTSERITSRDELGQIAVAYSQARGEKSRLEEQLRQADRLSSLGMLAAGTAHELNEPLGAILGFAQLARKATGLPEPTLRDLGKIEKAALHAREVVAKLMLFARQAPPQKAPLDLRVVVDEALEFLRPRSEQDGIAIDSDLQAGLPEIVADASQLRQTVLNLVVNALQATARGGSVRVTLRAELSQLRLTVEDQGTGMSEEVRSKLFLPFFTTKDVGQGTGLGLSVVHGIVSAHGGSIEVESAAGRGTRFDVLLPLP